VTTFTALSAVSVTAITACRRRALVPWDHGAWPGDASP